MHIRDSLVRFVPLAVAITGMCFLVYAAVQQNYRQSLNDPQIQMAEDAAAALSAGATPQSLSNAQKIDIAQSLAPYLAIYNEQGESLVSTGLLNGAFPQPPAGVFDISSWNRPKKAQLASSLVPQNEDRLTWQPEAHVRQAIVVVHYSSATGGGFVLAGRNMREIENREGDLVAMIALVWMGTLLLSFVASLLVQRALHRR